MIRQALLLTLSALALRLVLTSLLNFATAVVANPRFVVQPQILQFILGLLSPVTLIAFLLALYCEISGYGATRRRQAFALAAAAGTAVSLGLVFWRLHETRVALSSLTPEARAQLPQVPTLTASFVRAGIRDMLPAVTWITFLLIFWREAFPLGRNSTRKLAAVLCVITVLQGVSSASRLLAGLQRYIPNWTGRPIQTSWNLIILPAVFLFSLFAVPYFLFSVWRSPPAHDPANRTAPVPG